MLLPVMRKRGCMALLALAASVSLSAPRANAWQVSAVEMVKFGDITVNSSTVQVEEFAADTVGPVLITGDFSQSTTCDSQLHHCQTSITFQPSVSGLRSGFLMVCNQYGQAQKLFVMVGTGVEPRREIPQLVVSSSSQAFASQVLGIASAAQQLTIVNGGTAVLQISNVVVDGPFTQTNNC